MLADPPGQGQKEAALNSTETRTDPKSRTLVAASLAPAPAGRRPRRVVNEAALRPIIRKPMSLAPGVMLGRYEFQALLGAGGMEEV